FFQAEDGIRDRNVTGVQTCALPIFIRTCSAGSKPSTCPLWLSATTWLDWMASSATTKWASTTPTGHSRPRATSSHKVTGSLILRSEERRVGKECRARWGRDE